jgi:predicted nucleotidyltransferase
LAIRKVKLDKRTHLLLSLIAKATAELGIDWLVVGAAGRVMLLEQVYGLAPGRATEDIDLGVMVASWSEYEALVVQLGKMGLHPHAKQRQRFTRGDDVIDLVPFGDIASNESLIRWPPENEIAMTVLGFREAFSHAETVSVEDLTVSVVNPIGLMLLKLIAWQERHLEFPKKDAADIAYVLRHYSVILGSDVLFGEHLSTVEEADYDLELAAAHVLGAHVVGIAEGNTRVHLRRLLDGVLKEGVDGAFVREVGGHFPGSNVSRVSDLITRFVTGFMRARKD